MPDALVRQRVAEIVDVVCEGRVRPVETRPLEEPAEWDSLRHIEIILAVEEEFEITIAEDDFASLRSIDSISEHIASLRAPH
jgi:acyl carrier protein